MGFDQLPNPQMEPTGRITCAFMSPWHAAHLQRWAVTTPLWIESFGGDLAMLGGRFQFGIIGSAHGLSQSPRLFEPVWPSAAHSRGKRQSSLKTFARSRICAGTAET